MSIWYEGLFSGFLWKEWGNITPALRTLLNASCHQVCYRFVLVKVFQLDFEVFGKPTHVCRNKLPSQNKINIKDSIQGVLKWPDAIRKMAWAKGLCYSGMAVRMCRYVDTSAQQLVYRSTSQITFSLCKKHNHTLANTH